MLDGDKKERGERLHLSFAEHIAVNATFSCERLSLLNISNFILIISRSMSDRVFLQSTMYTGYFKQSCQILNYVHLQEDQFTELRATQEYWTNYCFKYSSLWEST